MDSSASTKGQVWYTDFIIGALIFIGMLVFFFVQLERLEQPTVNRLDELLLGGRSISNELLTPGVPPDWTVSDVARVGIAQGQRINQTKLDRLQELNYSQLKTLLRTPHDFFIFLERRGCIVQLDGAYGIGHPQVDVQGSGCVARSAIDLSAADADDLIPVTRFVVHNATPTKLIVYVWS